MSFVFKYFPSKWTCQLSKQENILPKAVYPRNFINTKHMETPQSERYNKNP